MNWNPDAAPEFYAADRARIPAHYAAEERRETFGSMRVVVYALATCLAFILAVVALWMLH